MEWEIDDDRFLFLNGLFL